MQEAIPANAAEFAQSGKLTLKLSKIYLVNPQDVLFSLPTISDELPLTGNEALFHDFEETILEDDWRQNEFLNPSSLPLIDKEIEEIKAIWGNHSKPMSEDFTAFDKMHVRDTIGEADLRIDLQPLQDILGTNQLGQLKLKGNDGFVKDAFAIRTEATTYYGTLRDGIINQLCISSFSDDSIGEIQAITKAFDLVFVNWYHGEIVTSDDE